MNPFENRYGYIYLVTNLQNGKKYVGKTISTVERRWDTHISHAEHNRAKMALHGAIRKYGAGQFQCKQICWAKEGLLCKLERFFIKQFNCRIESGNGYNMTDGGEGMSGRRPSKATRQKMSAALIGNKRGAGRVLTQQEREHLMSFVRGVKRTPEFYRRMSLREGERYKTVCKNGHPRTTENTRKYTSRGKVHTECMDCRKLSPSRQKPPPKEDTGLCPQQKHLRTPGTWIPYKGRDGYFHHRCKGCDSERAKLRSTRRKSE